MRAQAAASAFAPTAGVRVVYVAGAMRSGTTLLAEVLGSFESAVAVGELNNTWRALAAGQRCSCGATPAECPVWSSVSGEGERGEDHERLRLRLERQRRLPLLLSLARLPERHWPEGVATYISVLRRLVGGLAAAAGATMLIDSSKSAPGLALMRLAVGPGLDVVHLIRDPRGVAHSERRRRHVADEITAHPPAMRSLAKSTVEWNASNLECALLGRAVNHYHRTTYDRFCEDPEGEIRTLASDMGWAAQAPHFDRKTVVLQPCHILAGNPSRTGGRWREITPDDSWREGLSPLELAAIRAATWPTAELLCR